MSKEIARLNFEGKLKTAMQETGQTQQELDFGAWQATIAYGYPQRDGRRAREPVTHTEPLWSRSAGPMSSWLPVWTPASTFIFTAGCQECACRSSRPRKVHLRTVQDWVGHLWGTYC